MYELTTLKQELQQMEEDFRKKADEYLHLSAEGIPEEKRDYWWYYYRIYSEKQYLLHYIICKIDLIILSIKQALEECE